MSRFVFTLILLGLATDCQAGLSVSADLEIELQKVPFDATKNSDVQISWIGNGVFDGTLFSTSGSLLEFINFGEVFEDAIEGTGGHAGSPFNLTNPLTLSGTATDFLGASVPFTSSYGTLRLDDQSDVDGTTSDDVDLLGDGFVDPEGGSLPIVTGGNYTASGISFVEGLSFSSLIPGSYFTDSSGDAAIFGGVGLSVVAIPEPSAFLFGGLVCVLCVCLCCQQRKSVVGRIAAETPRP